MKTRRKILGREPYRPRIVHSKKSDNIHGKESRNQIYAPGPKTKFKKVQCNHIHDPTQMETKLVFLSWLAHLRFLGSDDCKIRVVSGKQRVERVPNYHISSSDNIREVCLTVNKIHQLLIFRPNSQQGCQKWGIWRLLICSGVVGH
jgi:hypothetical protein